MIPPKIMKVNYSINKNKKIFTSLKKSNHKMSKRIEDVLNLNFDRYNNISKSADNNKKDKQEKENVQIEIKNPLLLSSSIKQVQNFLPNVNDLLNTDTDFKNNPSRQEHIKFEENIKNEISHYTQEENKLKEKLHKVENKLINLDNQIEDSKIEIQALKALNVNDSNSILRKMIIKKCEEEFYEQEYKMIKRYDSLSKKSSPKKRKSSKMNLDKLNSFSNQEFTTRLNLKLMKEDKLNREKQKKIMVNMEAISYDKEIIHKKLMDIHEELKIIHNRRKILIEKLYKHYLRLLKDGKDSRKDGLAWIIIEIFYLNKKVLTPNFPKYLDIDCIHYLFKMANLTIKIMQLENKVKDKKENLNKYLINDKSMDNQINKNYFYDDTDESNNIFEYNKKQLAYIISIFSQNINNRNGNDYNDDNDNLFRKTKPISEISNTISNINNDIEDKGKNYTQTLSSRKPQIFKTSKNYNQHSNTMGKSVDYFLYKNPKKKIYKVNDIQNYFNENNKNNSITKENEALKSNEYLNYSNLSNELFLLKKEKDELKIKEMNRIFKEFQRNNYKERFQVDKKTVINALIGEDNLDNELIRQERRERDYIYKMKKIQLYQSSYQGKKKFN